MKKILVSILLIVTAVIAKGQFTGANLQAAGLTCAMCTKAINNSLEKLPFIQSVKADIKTSTFNIVFREGVSANFDELRKAVEDAGFSVARLKVTGQFKNLSIQNDAHVQVGDKMFHFLNVPGQTLDGEKSIVLVDKAFIGQKEFKKISSSSKMSCVQTGKAGECCTKAGVSPDTRIYHVTI